MATDIEELRDVLLDHIAERLECVESRIASHEARAPQAWTGAERRILSAEQAVLNDLKQRIEDETEGFERPTLQEMGVLGGAAESEKY